MLSFYFQDYYKKYGKLLYALWIIGFFYLIFAEETKYSNENKFSTYFIQKSPQHPSPGNLLLYVVLYLLLLQPLNIFPLIQFYN
jgi:hypothetical protein